MRYFLGVEVPSSLTESILQYQREWNIKSLMPHITVKAPCGLSPDAVWLPQVRQECKRFEAIQIQIGGVGSFTSSVLFLRVVSPGLVDLHNRLVTELQISSADQDACFEGPRYSPHLTLLQTQPNQAFTQSVEAAAAKQFGESILLRADFLAVYRKDSKGEYRIVERVPFNITI